MPTKKDAAMKKYYLLKIALIELEPEVWRRFIVPADISFDRLHDIIQALMGWKDSHLHEFNFGNKRYVENIDEEFDGEEAALESSERLNKHFKKQGDSCVYIYDFGDSWAHRITLENPDYSLKDDDCEICCLDGARACPPEDVGGPPGYEDFCKVIKNTKSKKHAAMAAWSKGSQPGGQTFDPEYFDLDAVNETLGWFVRWSRPRKLV
ncbi:MAG: plasmid pRiA4b ORF-3 family protein [Erysipelotrichia bacterium]|nr:plasmid pRiA4b ORF-3 family protein [Erysipelotrichia bacterium]